jgi:murein DD-endopeptidase MepM/ murein hydrolase activator NlpD
MSASQSQSVKTGQFDETGVFAEQSSIDAAYCPIERRRRGPAALAASLTVLFAGVTFLGYAMMTTPERLSPAPSIERQVVKITPIAEPTPQAEEMAVAEAAPAESAPITVAEALAQSRAARQSVQVITSTPPQAEAVAVERQSDDGFTPRLKPARKILPNLRPSGLGRAAKIGGFLIAELSDAPPPVFFPSDMERQTQYTAPPAVLYAGDLERGFRDIRIRITKGENFVDALKRAGVNARDRNDAAYAFGKHYNLRRLRPGQEFLLTLGQPYETLFQNATNGGGDARLVALKFRADAENRIFVQRDKSGGFSAETTPVPLTTRMLSVAGRINGSLYVSAKAAGAPDQIIADLADAFSYDVDFQREIFGGDEFEAIFEARYDDQGALVSTGDIVFARLYWRGRSREKGYYRFAGKTDGKRGDYYDASGQGAKRLLMKTPIDGARLSSRFGRRKHPILGYRRAHKGVDFAASRGTPIKAAGDGVVERANRYGSFGNYVRIRHANGYKTAYAHLKGFRRGIRAGKRVRQGDIIGYVGTTGRSTGPHLHYEVHLKGKAVNPQKLKIATGKKLRSAELDRFKIRRDQIDAMRLPQEDPASQIAGEGGAKSKAP